MGDDDTWFEERVTEIEAYLDLLESIQNAIQQGVPRIADATISVQHQRVLHSAVYLQLYNLVEATASRCLAGITRLALEDGRWRAADLSFEVRKEWLRVRTRVEEPLNSESRLELALELCEQLLGQQPVPAFDMRGPGGNWADDTIEKTSLRLGVDLQLSKEAVEGARRHIRDEMGALKLVRHERNRLAHGELSFAECGTDSTVQELRGLATSTITYLREVVAAYSQFASTFAFLQPESRPA